MCFFSPDVPELPDEPAKSRLPDGGVASASASQRLSDRMRAKAKSILTSPLGITETARTGGSTVLGSSTA